MRTVALLAGALIACTAPSLAAAPARDSSSSAFLDIARSPLVFEANRGQADARARYLARIGGSDIFLTDGGAVLALSAGQTPAPSVRDKNADAKEFAPWLASWLASSPVREEGSTQTRLALHYRFANANSQPRIDGIAPLPGRSNYFIGDDPRQWHADIPQYARVRYREVLLGVDVVYYGNDGRLEFDVEVAPGVDLASVRLRIDGADALDLDANGDLKIRTALGELRQRKPVVYQTIAGQRHEIRGGYVLLDRDERGDAHALAFVVPDYDSRVALVLDPTLDTSFLFGGTGSDTATAVAADASGNWYIAGYTSSSGAGVFPTTAGAYQTANAGNTDVFVRKLSNDGATIIYSTLIGGGGQDTATGIGVDANGIAYISGNTQSANFPTSNALIGSNPGNLPGFVTALKADGSGLVYSTYLGGNASTSVNGIAVDAAGDAYVTGTTAATNLPTNAGAFQTTTAALQHSAFVFQFLPSGARGFGTYIVDDYLGFGADYGNAIAIDDEGNSYIVGYTGSHYGGTYGGVTPATIGPLGGSYDILVARLNNTGTWLDWVTQVGGGHTDEGTAIAVDGGHQVVVGAWSNSDDLAPNTGQTAVDWAWIGRIDETGTQLLDSIWLGAAGADVFPNALVLLPNDKVLVAGDIYNPSALPAINALSNDCASICGPSGTYGGLIATVMGDPTIESQTRVTGGTGSSNTHFYGAGYAPAGALPNLVVGVSDGTPPGTTKPPPGTGSDAVGVGLDAVTQAPPLPPVVSKYFDPPVVAPNQPIKMRIVVRNPNPAADLTNLTVNDILPACLFAVPRSQKLLSCSSAGSLDYDIFNDALELLGVTIPGDGECVVELTVRAQSGICTNTTLAATSDQGGAPPAGASVLVTDIAQFLWTGAGGDSNTDTPGNWNKNAPPTPPADAVFPAGPANTTVNNNLPAGQVLNQIILSGNNYGVDGAPIGLLGTINNSGSNNAISAPINIDAPHTFVLSDPVFATLAIYGPIGFERTFLDAFGAGTTNFNGVIGGTGSLSVFGPGRVSINAAPTFSGSIYLGGGSTYLNATLIQPLSLFNDAVASGGGPYGPVFVSDNAQLAAALGAPWSTQSPATVSMTDLTVNGGLIMLPFGAGNASNSTINASGNVDLNGGILLLDFATAPADGTVFSALINSPGGKIAGCFAYAFAAQPNLVLKPLCTTTSVGAQVTSSDRIAGFDFDFNIEF